MTSFKRFGSKPHGKICVCQLICNVIICFGCYIKTNTVFVLALCVDILTLAITRGKIFGIKGQPVVKSVYIQARMNYFLK